MHSKSELKHPPFEGLRYLTRTPLSLDCVFLGTFVEQGTRCLLFLCSLLLLLNEGKKVKRKDNLYVQNFGYTFKTCSLKKISIQFQCIVEDKLFGLS